jgi:hypothetical protein
MSHGKLREDTNCQNCGDDVTVRFCPSCGQENTETKKSFHYLFTHFLEDLVHYDNSFWKAVKYLIFAPYLLSIEYLKGRRKKYIAPVKLFIFMNFLTFFLTAMLSYDADIEPKKQIKDDNAKLIQIDNTKGNLSTNTFVTKLIKLNEKYSSKELLEKIGEKFRYYFPKVLFAYLPIFAFFLWLFHNKKRWWYFDHGIFTFHFFSSTMLLISIHSIIDFILFKLKLFNTQYLFGGFLFIYIFYLFYKSHKQLFLETKFKSFMKATLILFINFITMGIVALTLFVVSIMFIK